MPSDSRLSGRLGAELRRRREAAQLSVTSLAAAAGLSRQYVAALEADLSASAKYAKAPSFSALEKLARALSQRGGEGELREIAGALALAAMGLEPEIDQANRPLAATEELLSQARASGTEVWVVTDSLLEAEDAAFAQQTATNIRAGATYRYFVPFSMPSEHYQRAVSVLDGSADGVSKAVTIYQLSACAFIARMRISNPLGNTPEGTYSLGARSGGLRYYSAPIELVVAAVRVLHELCQAEAASADRSTPVVVPRTGEILRVYPSPHPRFSHT